jgi:hypothetical protein
MSAPYGYRETIANPYGYQRAVIAKAHRAPAGNILLDVAIPTGDDGTPTPTPPGIELWTYDGHPWRRLARIVIAPDNFADLLSDLGVEAVTS